MVVKVNVLFIIVIVLLVGKMADGYHKGMVKEIISFISLIFLCLTVALAGNGLSNYNNGKILNVLVTVFLLGVLGIAHHFISVSFLAAKLVSKLPVVHSVDKIMGILVGALEVILILWTVYIFATVMNLGTIGERIMTWTYENQILAWLYKHNGLMEGIKLLGAEIKEQLHLVS